MNRRNKKAKVGLMKNKDVTSNDRIEQTRPINSDMIALPPRKIFDEPKPIILRPQDLVLDPVSFPKERSFIPIKDLEDRSSFIHDPNNMQMMGS